MPKKYLVPKNVDPIELADRMKRGATTKFLKDAEELRRSRSR